MPVMFKTYIGEKQKELKQKGQRQRGQKKCRLI